MKIKNFVLFDVVFVEALLHFTKLHIPIKVSYPLQKCLKVFQAEELAVKTSRDELIKKYAAPFETEKGTNWDINKSSKEDQDKFYVELTDLMNIEFELPIENKLILKIDDIQDQKISTDYISRMELLLEFQ